MKLVHSATSCCNALGSAAATDTFSAFCLGSLLFHWPSGKACWAGGIPLCILSAGGKMEAEIFSSSSNVLQETSTPQSPCLLSRPHRSVLGTVTVQRVPSPLLAHSVLSHSLQKCCPVKALKASWGLLLSSHKRNNTLNSQAKKHPCRTGKNI